MGIILSLRFTNSVLRPTACWFVNRADPSAWIETALAGAQTCDHTAFRFLAIPRSPSDRTPIGAVIIAAEEGLQNRSMPLALPYGYAAKRLLVPVEADLDPSMTRAELEVLLAPDKWYVWHPQVGLVAFESEELLSLAELIGAGPRQPAVFSSAVTGTRLPARLTSLEAAEPPSLQDVMDAGRDDIGSSRHDSPELPRPANEPRPGIGNSLHRAGLTILDTGLRFVSGAEHYVNGLLGSSGKASGPGSAEKKDGWLDWLQAWAEQQLTHLNQAVLSEREKEMNRLMNLLEKNPDEGLKWALPIGGDAHRGKSTPSGHLMMRDTQFNLGHFGGGRPADVWDLSFQRQQQLTAKYRELANRESNLRRYRRAAYIYAELLTDYAAAANVLAQGHHYREAAVLLKDKLNQPLQAARCLEKGGLWTEAIEIYVKEKQYVQAGDLYARLDQSEEATRYYEIAITELRLSRDFLAAAKLVSEKLNDLDRTVATLQEGWPYSPQAASCLTELFATYARNNMHDAALRTVEHFRTRLKPDEFQVPLVEILAANAAGYPDRGVRALAADATRVLASRFLMATTVTERTRILGALQKSTPGDRLLKRDCLRFDARRAPAIPLTLKTSLSKRVVGERTFSLADMDDVWNISSVASSGDLVFAAFQNAQTGKLRITRTALTNNSRLHRDWNAFPAHTSRPIHMATDPNRPDQLLLVSSSHRTFRPFHVNFPETDVIATTSTINFLGNEFVAASIAPGGVRYLVNLRHESLETYDRFGTLLRTLSLPSFRQCMSTLQSLDDLPLVPMQASAKHFYLGVGRHLLVGDANQDIRSLDLEQQIQQLVVTPPHTRFRLLVSQNEGAQIYWDDCESGPNKTFATDLPTPHLVFTRGGFVIAAAQQKCQVYSTRDTKIELVGDVDLQVPAVGVVSGTDPERFGIVRSDGIVHIYRICAI